MDGSGNQACNVEDCCLQLFGPTKERSFPLLNSHANADTHTHGGPFQPPKHANTMPTHTMPTTMPKHKTLPPEHQQQPPLLPPQPALVVFSGGTAFNSVAGVNAVCVYAHAPFRCDHVHIKIAPSSRNSIPRESSLGRILAASVCQSISFCAYIVAHTGLASKQANKQAACKRPPKALPSVPQGIDTRHTGQM
eukprot:1160400-Pelagomonas_calceolata.AAC.5